MVCQYLMMMLDNCDTNMQMYTHNSPLKDNYNTEMLADRNGM